MVVLENEREGGRYRERVLFLVVVGGFILAFIYS